MSKKVLVLDGGGARGIIQSRALLVLEEVSGKPIHEIFDLIIGTSIGSIVGGSLASGKISAKDLHKEMLATLPKVFKKKRRFRNIIRKDSLYVKKPLHDAMDSILGADYPMVYCSTKFVGVAINDLTAKPHFFRSWEDVDSHLQLSDIMDRSSAAPVYFGGVNDPEYPAVWLDGGIGLNNNPSAFALLEVSRLGWDKETVEIISLGAGASSRNRKYNSASKDGLMDQVRNYMKNGGYAHSIAERSVSHFVDEVCYTFADNVEYSRIQVEIDEELDIMDGIKFLKKYDYYGLVMATELCNIYTDWKLHEID